MGGGRLAGMVADAMSAEHKSSNPPRRDLTVS